MMLIRALDRCRCPGVTLPALNPALSPEKWARIREIYAKLLEAPEDQHAALLDQLCADDIHLRSEMTELLSAHGHAGSFLEEDASAVFNHLLAPALRELTTGTVLASRFHILRYIDTGGMGAVYEAWDTELKEPVALKTIRPEIASHPSIIERFKEEVRQAHHVTHPNICRVNDLFSHDFSTGHRLWFLTMQLLKGETLQQRLRRDGPLPRAAALEVVRQIISGLSEAHRHGIVHRDFKSGNIMLVEQGNQVRALITDFGLASEATTEGLVSTDRARQGTPAYTAPEQWFDGAATPAADQYSLGVVMCEMLTGERPEPARREGDSTLPARLPPRRKLDRHWDRAIRRCLEVPPQNRFHFLDDILKTIDPVRRRRLILRWATIMLAAVFVSATAMLVVRDLERLPVLAGRGAITPATKYLSQGPRFSSDGKMLVYVSDQGRIKDIDPPGLDVFVYPVPDGPPARITTYPTNAERPTLSKNGDWIAFETSQPPAGIYLANVNANVNGEAPVLIAHDGHEPSFSPDGHWILYSTGGDEFLSLNHARIYLYNLDSRQHFRLAKDLSDARIPLWNSDGDHILFSGCGPQSKTAYPICRDWWVTSVTNERPGSKDGPLQQPQPTGAALVLSSQKLQPTQYLGGWQNDTVVFSAHRESQVVSLWEIKLNPRKARVEGQARQLALGNQRDFIISSSITGKSIATCEWNPSIHIRRLEDFERGPLPKESPVTFDSEFDMGPSVSRNGRFLIFTRGYKQARKIHVLDTSNHDHELREPAFQDTEINSPIIDDSGTRIAFEATENNKPVIRVSIDKKGERTLCIDCRNPTGWMNESTRILYGDRELASIQVKDINGGDPVTIFSADGKFVRDAAWSPETKYIAFTVLKEVKRQDVKPDEDDRAIVMQVFAAPYAAGQRIPEDKWIAITGEKEFSRKPQWSENGKTIYFLSKRDGNWCVWGQTFDPDRGRPVGPAFEVRPYHDPKETPGSVPASGLNLSVAGDKLYLNVLETTGIVYLGELAHPGLFSRDD